MASDIIARALALSNAKKIRELPNGYRAKGSVPTIADLPISGNEIGDMYTISSTGQKYAWGKSGGILTWYKVNGDNDFVEQSEFNDFKQEVNTTIRPSVHVVTESVEHKGFDVPDLSAEQITNIYNAISINGQSAMIVFGDQKFFVDNARATNDDIEIDFIFKSDLLLNYALGDSVVITSKEFDGGEGATELIFTPTGIYVEV